MARGHGHRREEPRRSTLASWGTPPFYERQAAQLAVVSPALGLASRRPPGLRLERWAFAWMKGADMDTEKDAPRSRHRIEIKLNEEQKMLIVRGAQAAGVGISEFVRSAAEAAARAALSKR
jgi:hypothetical protein